MARGPNNYYQNPGAEIGSALATAIFGNPTMAAAQRAQQVEDDMNRARAEQARAAAAYDMSRADGQGIANTAQSGLPALVQQWVQSQQPAPPAPTVSSPGFADFDAPMPMPQARPDAGSALAELVGGMGQMQGDKIDPRQIVGTLAAMIGGDELARRSMIVQGHTPTKDFALTPERADAIANRDATADRTTKYGVAEINNRDDIPVAQIAANSRIEGAKIGAGAKLGVAEIKEAGSAPSFAAIKKVFPNATMTSGWRSAEHNRAVGGVANSTHLGNTPGVQGYDIPVQPGISIDEAAKQIEAANPGVAVVEKLQHRATRPDGSKGGVHWHFALQNTNPGKPSKAKASAPKPMSKAQDTMLSEALDKRITNVAAVEGGTMSAKTRRYLRNLVDQNYRNGMSPEIAVDEAFKTAKVEAARINGAKRKAAPKAAPAGGGERLTPAQAEKLPRGTKFVGTDGIERIRQ